ncbi:MAG: glycosyltransferase family 39 protein [Bacteroidales bacterium]|nr:glycosyltransferase family 39 protein [Bacteroidales bacterium]
MKSWPLFLIVLSLFLIAVSPDLWSDGMFLDGVTYADVALNISEKNGSIWDLHYSSTLFPQFNEHPPLGMYLLSLFYKVLGESIIVERIFSFFTIITSSLILQLIWTKIAIKKYHNLGFIPIFLFLTVPVVMWATKNNMLENTMMVFTNFSLLMMVKSVEQPLKKSIISICIASFTLMLAFLTKGPTSLYLLSFFFWFGLFNDKTLVKRFIFRDTFLLLSFLVLSFALLFLFIPEAYESFQRYINKQVVGSLENVVTVDTRFFIVKRFFSELIPMLIILVLVLIFNRKNIKNISKKWVFILLALSFSGILPIMISMKQSGFYILTVYPIVAIAIALIITPSISPFFEKLGSNKKIITSVAIILFIGALIFSNYQTNKIGKDKEMLTDIYKIINFLDNQKTIGVSKSLSSNWAAHAYFYRLKRVSLDANNENDFF